MFQLWCPLLLDQQPVDLCYISLTNQEKYVCLFPTTTEENNFFLDCIKALVWIDRSPFFVRPLLSLPSQMRKAQDDIITKDFEQRIFWSHRNWNLLNLYDHATSSSSQKQNQSINEAIPRKGSPQGGWNCRQSEKEGCDCHSLFGCCRRVIFPP